MKNQVLSSSKDKSKKLKCCLLQFLFGALRVKALLTKANSLQQSWFGIEIYANVKIYVTSSLPNIYSKVYLTNKSCPCE